MPNSTDSEAPFKQQAGDYAASLVESGMVVGLGPGSTAIFATRNVAARLHAGDLHDIVAMIGITRLSILAAWPKPLTTMPNRGAEIASPERTP